MRLRELTEADCARCAELDRVLFPGETPWGARVFAEEMAQPRNFYFGVEAEGVLAGYAGISMRGPDAAPEFEIHTIGTDPAYQRRGIGRMMLDNIAYIADLMDAPVFLEVRVGNDPAIALYESFGFAVIGLRRAYYQPSGADAHTMMRPRPSERKGKE